MEKTQTEILNEILAEISAIKQTLNSLESKIFFLSTAATPQGVAEANPAEDRASESTEIDLSLDDFVGFDIAEKEEEAPAVAEEETPIVEEDAPAAEEVETPIVEEVETPATAEEETPILEEESPAEEEESTLFAEEQSDEASTDIEEDLPEADSAEEEVPAPVAATETPASVAQEKVLAEEAELDLFGQPVVRVNEKLGAGRAKSVAEKLVRKETWRTAIPGPSVRDVRSAISLNDRVLFIRELFGGDAQHFHKAADTINSMKNLDEMTAWISAHYPDWDLDSDTVFRLMMAVRRKLSSNLQ